MDKDQFLSLLHLPESSTLEFKEELHKIYHTDKDTSRRHKNELCRDILSLANGNTISAFEPAYLIFGVGDKLSADGTRPIYGVSDPLPNAQQLLAILKGVSDPPIEHLLCDTFTIENKKIFVISIPPSPYLHETKRQLETPGVKYSEHVVFIRRGEEIGIASSKERQAIQDLKKFRHHESSKVNAVVFGGINGLVTGGFLSRALQGMLDEKKQHNIALDIASGLVTGMIGALFGFTYSNIKSFFQNLVTIPAKWRPYVISLNVGLSLGLSFAIKKIFDLLSSKKRANK